MSVSSSWDVSSDAELITAVRSGESAAFGVLYERHSGAARAVAHQYSNTAADADDSVAEAFSRVFTAIQTGGGPDVAFRAYLFTVIRRVALAGAHSGRRTQATDDIDVLEAAFGLGESTEDPTFAGFERSVVSRAYKSLPERWQAVLWYTEVEQLNAAEIAPVLGLSANGVAALAYRAREGLRQAYLQQHLASPASEACTIVNAKLGAYVRGGLAKRETALVESHLEECGDCRALVLELGDVNHGMRVVIAPLVLGAVAIGVLHGVGFGGALGTGAAAGAAAGAGTGTGTGSAGGGAAAGSSVSAGSGSLVGAGTGLAATGAVVGGVAAVASVAGGQSAAASGSSGSPLAGVGAGSGGTGAAGATGLAAVVGGVPVGAVGLVAAGLVVALAVGVSGMFGLFSGSPPPTQVGSGLDADQGEDAPADDLNDSPAGPSDLPDDDGTDPGDVAPPANPGVVTPTIPAPGTTTTPSVQSTAPPAGPTPSADPTPPPADPTPPPPPPVDPPPPPPANLVANHDAVDGVAFLAGQQQVLELGVSNDGGSSSGPVHTELTFSAGSQIDVQALDAMPSGSGFSVSGVEPSDWSCAVDLTADPVTATCTLPDLAPGASSTLLAGVTLDFDGETELDLGVRTWAPSLGPPPAARFLTTQLSSLPAVVVVDPVPEVTLVGDNDALVSTQVVVPVRNTGGTSVPAAQIRVSSLPDDVGIAWSDGWDCVRSSSGSRIDCTGPELPRWTTEPTDATELVLTLSDTEDLVDVDATTWANVWTATPASPAYALATSFRYQIRSAPADVTISGPASVTLQRGVASTVTFGVDNDGRTTAQALVADVDLPAGVFWDQTLEATADWACDEAPSGSNAEVTCTLAQLAPGGSADLVVPVRTNGSVGGVLDVSLAVVGGETLTASTQLLVSVDPAPLLTLTLDAETVVVQNVPRELSLLVGNTGDAPATGLVMTLDLPPSTFWEGVAADSAWTCTEDVVGSNRTVECTLPELLAGEQVEMAGSIRVTGAAPGRVILVDLVADGGLTASDETAVVVGVLPACATPWVRFTHYDTGDVVSVSTWNYSRNYSAVSVFRPSLFEFGWSRLGACDPS